VRNIELARVGAGLAPRQQELPVRRELVDARIAVAVGDVELAPRGQGGVRAAVERLTAHVGPRRSGHADGQQHLAVEGAVADGVVAVVGQPERVVGRHVHAVRAAKKPLAPGPQEVAVAVEDDHRVRAAVERVDAVLRVHPDGGDVRIELTPRRELRPAVDDLVAMRARAQDDRHRVTPP
jgi:hypothetical protein